MERLILLTLSLNLPNTLKKNFMKIVAWGDNRSKFEYKFRRQNLLEQLSGHPLGTSLTGLWRLLLSLLEFGIMFISCLVLQNGLLSNPAFGSWVVSLTHKHQSQLIHNEKYYFALLRYCGLAMLYGILFRLSTWSTLVQIKPCCLMVPSYYLNQCIGIIDRVQWHSLDMHQLPITKISLKITYLVPKTSWNHPRLQRLSPPGAGI